MTTNHWPPLKAQFIAEAEQPVQCLGKLIVLQCGQEIGACPFNTARGLQALIEGLHCQLLALPKSGMPGIGACLMWRHSHHGRQIHSAALRILQVQELPEDVLRSLRIELDT